VDAAPESWFARRCSATRCRAEPNYPQCSEALDLIGQIFEIDRDTEDPSLLEGDAKTRQAAETSFRLSSSML